MLRHLSSSRDNGQSMVIYPFGINHAPSVVIVSLKRSSIVIYHSSMKHPPPVVIVSLQRPEHGNVSLFY